VTGIPGGHLVLHNGHQQSPNKSLIFITHHSTSLYIYINHHIEDFYWDSTFIAFILIIIVVIQGDIMNQDILDGYVK